MRLAQLARATTAATLEAIALKVIPDNVYSFSPPNFNGSSAFLCRCGQDSALLKTILEAWPHPRFREWLGSAVTGRAGNNMGYPFEELIGSIKIPLFQPRAPYKHGETVLYLDEIRLASITT